MRIKLMFACTALILLVSCHNNSEKRVEEKQKDVKKKELIYGTIEKNWVFNAKPINAASQAKMKSWKEWRIFLTELDQKPKKTIGAFQNKSKALSSKVMALSSSLPIEFDNPQTKSRIAILVTKFRMLELYIHLKQIPEQKVVSLVPEINQQLVALQNQMDKIVLKSKIPFEQGESDLIKMLDAARAIPNTPQQDPNTLSVE